MSNHHNPDGIGPFEEAFLALIRTLRSPRFLRLIRDTAWERENEIDPPEEPSYDSPDSYPPKDPRPGE